MATLYATRQDVRDAFEGTIADNAKNNTRLDRLIARASARLASKVPGLDSRMAKGEIDPEVPEGMVVEAILRVWRNPAGSTQQGVGPFQLTFNKKAAENEIVFDQDEVDLLNASGSLPSSFRVAYPGREKAVDGLIDSERAQIVAVHFPGL